jgi:hypothetical protein
MTAPGQPGLGINQATLGRRRVWLGVLALVALIGVGSAIATIIRSGWDPSAIHDPTRLPTRISLCGRDYSNDRLDRQVTLDQARAIKSGGEPTVVATGPFAPCPAGACTTVADGPCDTVVFVRVGSDAYIGYALSGGP